MRRWRSWCSPKRSCLSIVSSWVVRNLTLARQLPGLPITSSSQEVCYNIVQDTWQTEYQNRDQKFSEGMYNIRNNMRMSVLSVLKQNLPRVRPPWYCSWNIWEMSPHESADLLAPWRKKLQLTLNKDWGIGIGTPSWNQDVRICLFSIVMSVHKWHMSWLIMMISTFQATMRQALPKSCSWLSFKGTKAKNLGRKEYMRRWGNIRKWVKQEDENSAEVFRWPVDTVDSKAEHLNLNGLLFTHLLAFLIRCWSKGEDALEQCKHVFNWCM